MTQPSGMTPEQIAEASAAEIAKGRLPLQAQWRIAQLQHERKNGIPNAFTSDLSTQEFAAIRSVGFSPVGQVMGSAVFNVGWSYTGCGYYGAYGYGSYSPAPVVDVPAVAHLLEQARHRAVERMRTECLGFGGDGVVGVNLTVRPFYGNGLEFMAIGTAVRADGNVHPKHTFTSDLSGQDFAKLIRAGFVPVDLVQGVGAVIRHDDWTQAMQQRSWMNQELTGSTNLVSAARAAARESLARDTAKRGGTSVVVRDMTLKVFETRCATMTGNDEAEDHLCEAFIWGTAVVPVTKQTRSRKPEMPLPMLRLDKTGQANQRKGRR